LGEFSEQGQKAFAERRQSAAKAEFAYGEGGFESLRKQAAEQMREHPNREEEAGEASHPTGPIQA
jgi:hypothetical protein